MLKGFLKKHKVAVLLISIILLVYLISAYHILSKSNNSPVTVKSARNIIAVEEFNEIWQEYGILKALKDNFYATFHLLCGSIILKITGNNYTLMVLLLNTGYLIILMVFTYLLGKHIAGIQAGLISILLLSLYPAVYIPFKEYFLEFPATALMSMSVYFLIRSDGFKNRKWVLLLCIGFAWGMLTRKIFAFYIFGPILTGLYSVLADSVKKKYYSSRNFLIFTVLSVFIILYSFDLRQYDETFAIDSATYPWYSFDNLRIFTVGLWEQVLSPPFLLVLLIGTLLFIRSKKVRNPYKITLSMWWLMPYLLMILTPKYKTERYFLLFLPVFAIISGIGLSVMRKDSFKKAVIFIVVILGLWQFYRINYKDAFNDIMFNYKDRYHMGYYKTNMNRTIGEVALAGRIAADVKESISKAMADYKRYDKNKEKYILFCPHSDYFFSQKPITPEHIESICFLSGWPVYVLLNLHFVKNMDNFYEMFSEEIDFIFYSASGKPFPYELDKPRYIEALKNDEYVQHLFPRLAARRKKTSMLPGRFDWEKLQKEHREFLAKFKSKNLIYEQNKRKIFFYTKYTDK